MANIGQPKPGRTSRAGQIHANTGTKDLQMSIKCI